MGSCTTGFNISGMILGNVSVDIPSHTLVLVMFNSDR